MYRIVMALGALVLLASGCAIHQTIEPAHIQKQTRLCIIENPKVRPGFITEFKAVLDEKKIPYTVVDARSVPADCHWTATYVARWRWDLALYMSYAEIKVFQDGSLDGQAIYDSTGGGANMNKFIDAEPKIRELVNELMQFRAASLFPLYFG